MIYDVLGESARVIVADPVHANRSPVRAPGPEDGSLPHRTIVPDLDQDVTRFRDTEFRQVDAPRSAEIPEIDAAAGPAPIDHDYPVAFLDRSRPNRVSDGPHFADQCGFLECGEVDDAGAGLDLFTTVDPGIEMEGFPEPIIGYEYQDGLGPIPFDRFPDPPVGMVW